MLWSIQHLLSLSVTLSSGTASSPSLSPWRCPSQGKHIFRWLCAGCCPAFDTSFTEYPRPEHSIVHKDNQDTVFAFLYSPSSSAIVFAGMSHSLPGGRVGKGHFASPRCDSQFASPCHTIATIGSLRNSFCGIRRSKGRLGRGTSAANLRPVENFPFVGSRRRRRVSAHAAPLHPYHLEITTLWSVKNDTASRPCAFRSP